jgi:hypothetical protein
VISWSAPLGAQLVGVLFVRDEPWWRAEVARVTFWLLWTAIGASSLKLLIYM